MRFPIVATVYRKEMLDLLRDRRTVISMIVIPVLAMPLLMFVMFKLVGRIATSADQEARSMAVGVRVKTPAVLDALHRAGIRTTDRVDLRAGIEQKEISAAVEEGAGPGGAMTLSVYQDSANTTSAAAGGRVRAALAQLREVQIRESLKKSGVSESVLTPFDVKEVNVAPERKMAGMVWGSILGYILLLMMFSGGIYPTIDMTAGEKERKTLEPFLATPVGRGEIVTGKILAAVSAVFVTSILTLSSMVISLKNASLGGPSGSDFGRAMKMIPLDPGTFLIILFTLLPLAVFAASLMMAIAMFARSYKEAQSYLTPLIFLVIVPAFMGGMPGFKLTSAMYLIPILNASQVIRTALLGEITRTPFLITLGANLVYAGIAAFVARKRFEDETVLFRS